MGMDADMMKIRSEYLEILTNGAGLADLCEVTAQHCGTPVCITLTTRTIIAKSANYTKELVDEYMNHLLLCTEAEVRKRCTEVEKNLYMRKTLVSCYPFMRYKHINCGCFHHTYMLGVLDCPITKKIDTNAAIAIIEMAAPIFMTALKLGGYLNDETTMAMQTYLLGILHGNPNEWYQEHNIYEPPLENIASWKLVWSPSIGELWARQRRNELGLYCACHEHIWFVEYEGGAVILMNAEKQYDLNMLADKCGKISPISVSESFSKLREMTKHLHAAQTTLHLAAFEENSERIVLVQNYKSVMAYLFLKQHHPTSLKLVHPAILQIKKYDQEHSSEYYETLRAYLLYHRNYSLMAKRLHIHKNTVSYRMQRLIELFEIDLTDCRTITALYLGLFEDYKQ